jgi:hypothetical protein
VHGLHKCGIIGADVVEARGFPPRPRPPQGGPRGGRAQRTPTARDRCPPDAAASGCDLPPGRPVALTASPPTGAEAQRAFPRRNGTTLAASPLGFT